MVELALHPRTPSEGPRREASNRPPPLGGVRVLPSAREGENQRESERENKRFSAMRRTVIMKSGSTKGRPVMTRSHSVGDRSRPPTLDQSMNKDEAGLPNETVFFTPPTSPDAKGNADSATATSPLAQRCTNIRPDQLPPPGALRTTLSFKRNNLTGKPSVGLSTEPEKQMNTSVCSTSSLDESATSVGEVVAVRACEKTNRVFFIEKNNNANNNAISNNNANNNANSNNNDVICNGNNNIGSRNTATNRNDDDDDNDKNPIIGNANKYDSNDCHASQRENRRNNDGNSAQNEQKNNQENVPQSSFSKYGDLTKDAQSRQNCLIASTGSYSGEPRSSRASVERMTRNTQLNHPNHATHLNHANNTNNVNITNSSTTQIQRLTRSNSYRQASRYNGKTNDEKQDGVADTYKRANNHSHSHNHRQEVATVKSATLSRMDAKRPMAPSPELEEEDASSSKDVARTSSSSSSSESSSSSSAVSSSSSSSSSASSSSSSSSSCKPPLVKKRLLLPGWTIRKFFHEICPRETEATVKWLLSRGLLRRNVDCSRCGRGGCALETAEDLVDRLAWVCGGEEGCGMRKSVRSESFFDQSRESLQSILEILFWWTRGLSVSAVAIETRLEVPVLSAWFAFARQVCGEQKDMTAKQDGFQAALEAIKNHQYWSL